MTVYTVHLRGEDVQAASFVPDGFSWRAFFIPPLWLLWHRLWLAFLLWCLLAIGLIAAPLHLSIISKELLIILAGFLCGLEGQQWRRQKLTRAGKPVIDLVSGDTQDDAEIHFFHRWAERDLPAPPAIPPHASAMKASPQAAAETPFGLFPEPERGL